MVDSGCDGLSTVALEKQEGTMKDSSYVYNDYKVLELKPGHFEGQLSITE